MSVGDIVYFNERFDGVKTSKAKEGFVVHRIPCELGEVYYQTRVNSKGLTKVAKGRGEESPNGLFISNDKIKELIRTGEIAKYSWLMQLVLTGKSSFLERAKAGNKFDGNSNSSVYYANGIFVPLKKHDAKAYGVVTRWNSKVSGIPGVRAAVGVAVDALEAATGVLPWDAAQASEYNKNEVVFHLPYDDKFRLKLRFNQENVKTPYDPGDIQELIIEHKNDNKNRYGVKQEYKNPNINKGDFFVMNDGKDVTSKVPTVIRDLKDSNGKSVAFLPTDLSDNKEITKGDRSSLLQATDFAMVANAKGNLRLKARPRSLMEEFLKEWASNYFNKSTYTKADGRKYNDYVYYDADNKKYIISGKLKAGNDTNNNVRIELDTVNLSLCLAQKQHIRDNGTNVIAGIDSTDETSIDNYINDFNNNYVNFNGFNDAKKVAGTNESIQRYLHNKAVEIDNKSFLNTTDKEKEIIHYANGPDLVLENTCGLDYDDTSKDVRSYIYDGIDVQEVRLFNDVFTKKTYYVRYDRTIPGVVGDPTEVGDQTILHCSLGQPKTYVMKKDNDKWITIATKKSITAAEEILKNQPEIKTLLTELKKGYNSGKMYEVFRQDGAVFSPAEKVQKKLGDKFQVQTESDGVVKEVCTYITPSAADQHDGKFELKTGETIQLANATDASAALTKEDEEAIKTGAAEDHTNVLSSGELFDFCASQIDAVKQSEQNNELHEDPMKTRAVIAGARAYLDNIRNFLPNTEYTPHNNGKFRPINNASGFSKHKKNLGIGI